MNGADLTNADLRWADLTGADLTGATLVGVQWDAANLTDLRGLTPSEHADLESKAARWKHELAERFDRLVRDFSTTTWLISWLAGAVVLHRGRQRVPGHLALRLFTGLHALAALPAFVFLFLIAAGASPTAQLSGNMDAWSAWVSWWGPSVGLAYLALMVFVPVAIVAWVACYRVRADGLGKHLAAATVLTGTSLFASISTLILLAPSA